MNNISRCRVCDADLIDNNWYPSFKLRNQRICKGCIEAQKAAYRLKWRREVCHEPCIAQVTNVHDLQCRVCHSELTGDNWRKCDYNTNNRICAECSRRGERVRARARYIPHMRKKRARRSMNENRQCTLFLGVHVAEQLLSKVFKDVQRMPIHNRGYDFICNRGKKIDVKSSCLTKDKRWKFKINHNQIPDFFLVIAFNNRWKLDPKHVWLIPKNDVYHAHSISIAPSTIDKWDKYHLDMGNVVACCDDMKS